MKKPGQNSTGLCFLKIIGTCLGKKGGDIQFKRLWVYRYRHRFRKLPRCDVGWWGLSYCLHLVSFSAQAEKETI
jgi:hypothetical protein